MQKHFSFLTQAHAVIVLRWAVASVFFLHAIVRLVNGTIAAFAQFMNEHGFVYGKIIVWILTVYEILGSILLGLNFCTKKLCVGFMLILVTGIVIIHAQLGWFVGEHGTGGVEYSFILLAALLVIVAGDTEKKKLNAPDK